MSRSPQPLVYIVSAPSGSGKSTLVKKLLGVVPDLDFSISYTTRAPRGVEQNGKQYHFINRQQFEEMIAADQFLEHADVFGNYYGTARQFLEEAEQKGHDLLLDIDVQGAAQIKRKLPEAISIFILPPNRATLEYRLRNRGEDSEEVIQRRLVTASREIENYDKYDYILINDRLDESCEKLCAIVLAERRRRSGQRSRGEDDKYSQVADSCRLSKVREKVQPILASFSVPASSARS
ncbi:MAG TPA: guanylate kinase [Dongiaceae bacterium]|nr:guanylate kinase [Dongiaceae bacterium]